MLLCRYYIKHISYAYKVVGRSPDSYFNFHITTLSYDLANCFIYLLYKYYLYINIQQI